MTPDPAAVDLYWLPLGAGGRSVRLNGRAFEAVASRVERRPARDLYHSALEVRLAAERFVIEMAPASGDQSTQRDVVAQGPVGTRWAGRSRIFRYEVRCWRDGRIPDVTEAVESPRRLSDDHACARRVLELIRHVPTPVWGRDELGTDDMWNSNSVTAWLIERSGIDTACIQPPAAGRAPGWHAGLTVARRHGGDQATRGPHGIADPLPGPGMTAGQRSIVSLGEEERRASARLAIFRAKLYAHPADTVTSHQRLDKLVRAQHAAAGRLRDARLAHARPPIDRATS